VSEWIKRLLKAAIVESVRSPHVPYASLMARTRQTPTPRHEEVIRKFDLKDPTPKHTLKAFPGAFSGMKIVSYLYAAFQQFMPGADVGIDLSKEYAAVKGG